MARSTTTLPAFELISISPPTPPPSDNETKGTSSSENIFSDYNSTFSSTVESNTGCESSNEDEEDIQISKSQGEAIAAPAHKPSSSVHDLSNKLAPQRPNPAAYQHLPPILAKAILKPISEAPNRNRFSVDNVVVVNRNEFVSPVTIKQAQKAAPENSVLTEEAASVNKSVEQTSLEKQKAVEDKRRRHLQEREEKTRKRARQEKENLAKQVKKTKVAREMEAARKAAYEEEHALDDLFEEESDPEAIAHEQLKLEADFEAGLQAAYAEDEEHTLKATIPAPKRKFSSTTAPTAITTTTPRPGKKARKAKDETKDAATIPASKIKFSNITPDSTPTTTPPPAKKAKKAKMPSQEELRAAIPAQGINFWKLAEQYGIHAKDMARAAKFEARVMMWFRKENGTVFLS